MKQQKKAPKKEQVPFWKKLSPEIKHISEHVGKFIDNLKTNDLVDLALYGSLAYLSLKTFSPRHTEKRTETYISGYRTVTRGQYYEAGYIGPGMERETGPYTSYEEPIYSTREIEEVKIDYDPKTALMGPIGLKLAQSWNLAGGISGVTILVALGLLTVMPQLPEFVTETAQNWVERNPQATMPWRGRI